MRAPQTIPAFGLYGERDPFPDVIHCEALSARAPQNDWRILPHRHDHMSQLFLMHEGSGEATVDDTRYSLAPGQFLFVPRHAVHGFVFSVQADGTVISFPQAIIEALAASSDAAPAILSSPQSGPVTASLRQAVQMLVETAERMTSFRSAKIIGLAHFVLAALAETADQGACPHQPVRPARLGDLEALIGQHMSEGWTAARYADALSITTGHLSRLCRAATGLGAAAFIERRIMVEACRLLAFTQLPVAQVGYRLGYEDPSYFSKRFRAAIGHPPTQYRQRFSRTQTQDRLRAG